MAKICKRKKSYRNPVTKMKFNRDVIIVVSALALSACAGKSGSPDSASTAEKPVKSDKGIDLVLKGHLGDESQTFYHSQSAVENFEDGQKVRDHQELMDFIVLTKVAEIKNDQFTIRTTTIDKDGTSALHDYAFPELHETIDFIYTKKAMVVSADPFPKESIFFLPPISLPDQPVQVGDTWTMNHAWISSSQGLPLSLDLVTIFKDLVSCGEFGKCADLEISGRIDIVNEKFQHAVSFDSHLWGRMLFSLDRGDVVWSEVRSHEVFKAQSTEVRVMSCMVSKMQGKSGKLEKQSCEPSLKAVTPPSL